MGEKVRHTNTVLVCFGRRHIVYRIKKTAPARSARQSRSLNCQLSNRIQLVNGTANGLGAGAQLRGFGL